MRRHALVYRNQRQRRFARKIVSRQPFAARLARHQRLLRELMPAAGTSERTGTLPGRSFNWALQRALPQARPLFKPLLAAEAEEEPVLSSVPSPVPDRLLAEQDEEDPGQEATFGLTVVNTMDRTEIGPSLVPDKTEKVSGQQEVHIESVNQLLEVGDQELASANRLSESPMGEPLEIQDRDLLLDQQIMERAATSDRSPEVPSARRENTEQSWGINEPVEAKLQQEQKITDEQGRPIGSTKSRRSRGRIQEQPAESVHTPPTLATPPSPSSNAARRNGQEAAGKEAFRADDLFAPQDTDRSPQAWMARLMGTASGPGDDVAAHAAAAETEPGGVQTSPVASDQLERKQQPKDSSQFILPARQGRFIPTGEELVAVTSQAKQSRRLKAGNQPLPIARPDIAPDSSQARPVSTPFSQRATRFLQPLVGIDPASVRVYRDAHAEQSVDDARADAIAVGDDVAIAVGHPDDTPETLGLLAHELTHVARRREPRFVPPVARSTQAQSSSMSEEALALRVESRVKRVAQEQVDQTGLISTEPAGTAVELSARTTSSMPASRSHAETWGGLPAPWEPLPDWLVSSTAMEESRAPVAASSSHPSQAAYEPGGTERVSENFGGGEIGMDSIPGAQRAGSERSLSMEEAEAATSQPSPDTAKIPEPDLDALARQVYTLLKRRLGVEYRRES